MAMIVFKPVVRPREGNHVLAPRPKTLMGATIGLLWNAKPNGDLYLETIRQQLRAKFATAEFLVLRKPSANKPMAPDVYQQLRRCTAVITALGD